MQKILIVEDDTNINNLLCEALTKEGYSCEQLFGHGGETSFKYEGIWLCAGAA